jgi:hypothetical protein
LILVIFSFAVQRLFNLKQSHLSVLTYFLTIGVLLRKLLPIPVSPSVFL